MSFSLKPDYESVKARYDAFWHREIIDRPPVSITLPLPGASHFPKGGHKTDADYWLDVEYRSAELDHNVRGRKYLYDALPIVYPNLGPEIFSAWCGCGYEFGPDTTWSVPCIHDWERDAPGARFDIGHPLFAKLIEFTRRLLDYGVGNYIVGLSDFHPGGDHLAALRDPQNLALDMIENVDWVKHLLESSAPEYFAAYGVFYHMLREAGMPITSWTPLIHDGVYYIPSNDFSCMVSKAMFDDVFLPGIRQECMFYERCIYHLDGPDALRHLDSLLDIPELDAVQWVCGSGNEGYARWIKVYQRIQAGGKALQLGCDIKELDMVFETLRPEGVWFSGISGIDNEETAGRVVDRISAWK